MLHDVGQFFDHDMPIEEVVFVPAGLLLPGLRARMQNAFALVQKNWLWMSVESFVVAVLTIVVFSAIWEDALRPIRPTTNPVRAWGL